MLRPKLECMGGVSEPHAGWTFLTSHARVLATIAENHRIRIRDIAARCRLTERAVQRIISDLEGGGYLTRTRQGRTNTYRLEGGTILRHPAEAGMTVEALLSALARHDARYDGRPQRSPTVRPRERDSESAR
jgi:predicted ArsR family transcriptional regulator